jgi:hypothetical protein
MDGRIWLRVPYDEKDEAKQVGGRCVRRHECGRFIATCSRSSGRIRKLVGNEFPVRVDGLVYAVENLSPMPLQSQRTSAQAGSRLHVS